MNAIDLSAHSLESERFEIVRDAVSRPAPDVVRSFRFPFRDHVHTDPEPAIIADMSPGASHRLALHLLGSPRIEVDGRAVSTDRRKAIALLAYLAVEGGSHEREALAALLWPDYDAASALAYLRRTLWEINQMLGSGFLRVERSQAALVVDESVWLDVHALARALQQGDEEAISRVVDLYRGDFMAGFSLVDAADFEDWQRYQVEKWRSELSRALDRLSARLGADGRFDQAVTYARRWVGLDPLHEVAQRRLIQLYAQSGNRAAAIHQYETLAAALAHDLAATPEPDTTALAEQVRAGSYHIAQDTLSVSRAEEKRDAAPLATVAAPPPVHIPTPATPFLGRKRELMEIATLLADANCRLLTLVGPGGMGKTRLAIEVAATTGPEYTNGAWFVPLAMLESSHQFVPALADSLEIVLRSSAVDARQQLLEFLHQRRLLLVLDNLEHLLQNGLVGVINDILLSAPAVKILATSRSRLNLNSEQVYPLGGMATPPGDETYIRRNPSQAGNYSALVLFAQCARRVQPDFELTSSNLESVAEICRRLGGMPLGIELAAGWMAVLSPAGILAEIERSLDFLETDQADIPERQRSLRTMLDASMAHLLPEERAVFERLGLFWGSFSRQAAEQIAGASLKVLLRLVNKSVVRRDADDRFEMHPVVARYAAENLHRNASLRLGVEQSFIAHYIGYLERHGRDLSGPRQKQALDALELDIVNIRQAWLMAVAAERWQEANATLEPLFTFHRVRLTFDTSFAEFTEKALDLLAHKERGRAVDLLSAQILAARSWHLGVKNWTFFANSDLPAMSLALVQEQGLESEMGFALTLLGEAISGQGEIARGLALIGESEQLLRQQGRFAALAFTLAIKAGLLHYLNRRTEAKAAAEESIAVSRQLGDRLQLAHSLSQMGDILVSEQDFDAATHLYAESQALYEALGDLGDVASVLYRLADSRMHSGHYEAAIAAFEACRRLFVRLGDRFYRISVLSWESLCAVRAGDLVRAWELRRSCLQEAIDEGEHLNIGWSTWEMGELYRLEGDWEAARRCYEESLALLKGGHFVRSETFFERGMGDLELALGRSHQAARHFQRSLDLAVAENYFWGMSRAHVGLGQVELALGDAPAAWEHFRLGLSLAAEWGMDQGLMFMAVAGLAATHLAQGEADKALEMAIFAQSQAATIAETRRSLSSIIATAAASLGAAACAAAEQEGKDLTLPAVVATYTSD